MVRYLFLPLGIAMFVIPFFADATVINLTRTLSFGMRGNDVVLLQNFLISQGHLAEGNATGYFGRLTQAAVQKYQCAQKIVCAGSPATTGWGVVGPRTRLAILQGFVRAPANFSASATSGVAPLAVGFNTKAADGKSYIVDTGDGVLVQMKFIPCSQETDACTRMYDTVASHTYTKPGVYVAKLYEQGQQIIGCVMPCPPAGTVTITVLSGGTSDVSTGLQGKVTRTTGNCMPREIDFNNPSGPGPNPCSTTPVARNVYVYPSFKSNEYLMPLDWTGASRYEYFGVFPTLGSSLYKAPLSVTFTTGNRKGGTIVFGDGEQVSCAATEFGSDPCNRQQIHHTYQRAGTYTAELKSEKGETLQRVRIVISANGVQPVAQTTSDAQGNYSVAVSPGSYSVFVEEDGQPHCTLFNGDGISCPVTVGAHGSTKHDININGASW